MTEHLNKQSVEAEKVFTDGFHRIFTDVGLVTEFPLRNFLGQGVAEKLSEWIINFWGSSEDEAHIHIRRKLNNKWESFLEKFIVFYATLRPTPNPDESRGEVFRACGQRG